MKPLFVRIILVWVTVLIAVFFVARSYESVIQTEKAQQNAKYSERIHTQVYQVINAVRWETVSERRDALARLSAINDVNGWKLIDSYNVVIEESEQRTGTQKISVPLAAAKQSGIPSQLLVYYDYPKTLSTSSANGGFLAAFILFVVIGLSSTWLLMRKLFADEMFAELILEGQREFSHSDADKKVDSAVTNAFHQLLAEHGKGRLLQEELSNRLRHHSFVDSETELGNRQYFDAEFQVCLHSHEEALSGTILLLSFDELSRYEHEEKDLYLELLRSLSGVLEHSIADLPHAYVARREQFDFAVLLLHQTQDQIERYCQKLIKDLSRGVFDATEIADDFIHIGCANFKTGDESYQVLSKADMALRNAQLQGPNSWYFYESGKMNNKSVRGSVRWRALLQRVLERREIFLYTHPVHFFEESQTPLTEVLARIQDKQEIITANTFLPMAHRCGISAEFDRLIVDQVLKTMLYAAVSEDSHVSVNLFPESVADRSFTDWLIKRLSSLPEQASKIVFEVSEYFVSRADDEFIQTMEKVKATGASWCIEHVGRPGANIDYLPRTPVRYIKLDQSLVRGIHEKEEKQLFIESIVNMVHDSQLLILADGVESAEEKEKLEELGLDGVQGYYFSKPVSMDMEHLDQAVQS